MVSLVTVASEPNQHCGGEARPEKLKLEVLRAKPGVGFLERGRQAPSPPVRSGGGL